MFLSDIMVKIFRLIFFSSYYRSFGNNEVIKYIFNSLISKVIILIAIIIKYTIREFRGKSRRLIKFKGRAIKSIILLRSFVLVRSLLLINRI